MLYERTSQDVKTEFHLFQDVFANSSIEEISVSIISKKRFLSFRGRTLEKLHHDSSSVDLLLKFISEIAFTEESSKMVEHTRILERVSRICDKLILEEEIFRSVDKRKLLKTISEILADISSDELKILENDLFERIRGVLVLEAISGILNELTPEQMKGFDEAVKRRPLFK